MTPQKIIQCCERQLMLGNPNVGFLLPGKWEISGRGIYVIFDAKEVMEATKRKMKKFGMLESEGKEG